MLRFLEANGSNSVLKVVVSTNAVITPRRKGLPTRMGLEPTRAEHNGLAVHRLNHSATSSRLNEKITKKKKIKEIPNHISS